MVELALKSNTECENDTNNNTHKLRPNQNEQSHIFEQSNQNELDLSQLYEQPNQSEISPLLDSNSDIFELGTAEISDVENCEQTYTTSIQEISRHIDEDQTIDTDSLIEPRVHQEMNEEIEEQFYDFDDEVKDPDYDPKHDQHETDLSEDETLVDHEEMVATEIETQKRKATKSNSLKT